MKKIAILLKHNRFIFFLYRTLFGFFFRFIGLFLRTDKKLILFVSYGGDSFNDSPKNIFDQILTDDFFKDYKLVWALKEKKEIEGASVIKIDTLKYFITALTAKVWITNVNIERGLRFKKRKTIYLNTWHGTGPKKGGRAIKGRNDYNFGNVDILCVDGEYSKINFIKYFKAKEESMLWCGRPREDKLFSYTLEDINKVKNELNIPLDKKVVFYAPTWRDGKLSLLNLSKFTEYLGDNYIVLIRFHHFSKDDLIDISKNIIDVTDYEDISDLYLISDYLISDYSSAFFDFGLLKKPYYCYATDYESYVSTTGLFISIKDEFVGGVFDNEESLAERITHCDYKNDSEACYEVCKKYVTVHTNATNECICSLKNKINLKEVRKVSL